ncbi:hypothetical protein MCUN1_003053 [Malassezia cuniculi]|uniref:Uncharacterized protein n=1 Tax=Malassezia cuniculi TaxID=948313 RepID=A0AAF0EXM5_9BASI|nr:hypothetical protein MCUN1_003053 [Malassezia cuniculi]
MEKDPLTGADASPGKGDDDGALLHRFRYQPYEPAADESGDLPSPSTYVASNGARRASERVQRLLTDALVVVLVRWRTLLAVLLLGLGLGVLRYNIGRPEWYELTFNIVEPFPRVPLGPDGNVLAVTPKRPIFPPNIHRCPGPGGKYVPLSPASAHPTPPDHPHPIVGSHKLVHLDDGQCITYEERYGMYTDKALGITYRLPDEELPQPAIELEQGSQPRIQRPPYSSYDPLHGPVRDPSMSEREWEERLRREMYAYNTRDLAGLVMPDWRALMDSCYEQRVAERGAANDSAAQTTTIMSQSVKSNTSEWVHRLSADPMKLYHPPADRKRTALVLRSYQGFAWSEDMILNVRALISELSLNNPGTPWDIRILVEVKDHSLSVFTSEWDRYRVLMTSVPREFWGLVDLWSERELEVLYAGLPGKFINNMIAQTSYRACLMALQKFYLDHQEYDYVWNWELDVRYIGNFLDYFEGVEKYARDEPLQPGMTKYEQWYIPNVTVSEQRWTSPMKETSHIGLEADLITLGPIFDPRGSGWYWTHDVQNYRKGQDTDRRASIGTNMRMSRGLLEAMNVVNAEAKKSLHCEAWSTTLVLHSQMESSHDHSFYPEAGYTYTLPLPFKGVFSPHPIYFRHEWDVNLLHSLLNRQDFYEPRRENLHRDSSFYYHSEHAREIYLGWKHGADVCRAPAMLHPIKRINNEPKYAP